MIKYCLHIVLLFISLDLAAQRTVRQEIDSLKKVVDNAQDDSTLVEAQVALGLRYYAVDQDTTLDICLQGANICKWYLESAQSHEIDYYSHKLMLFCNLIGAVYGGRGQYSESLKFFEYTLRIANQREDYPMVAGSHNNFGSLFQRQGKNRSALARFRKAVQLRDKHLNGTNKTYVTLNIGEVHETLADSCQQIGDDEQYTKEMNLAKQYYQDAMVFGEMDAQYPGVAAAHAKSANLQRKWGNLGEAKIEIGKALEYVNATGSHNTAPLVYRHSAWVYHDLGEYQISVEYAQMALEGARKLKSSEDIVFSCEILANSYQAIGKDELALVYYELFIEEGDVLNNENQQRKEIEQIYRLEYAKKIAADSARLANETFLETAEIARRESEIRSNRAQKVGMWVFIAALLGLIGITVYRSKRKRSDHDIILSQKEKVEYQRKKILDSLYYAERIQRSILPADEEIQKHLPHFSSIFIPREIVSGDFYWYAHVNGCSYIAISEGAEQGVAGAFTGMVGATLLKELIVKSTYTNPASILHEFDSLYKELFHDSGHELERELNLAIIKVNHDAHKLTFAAANQRLLVLKESLEVWEGDSRRIGGPKSESMIQFTNKELSTNEVVAIYLCTDGLERQLQQLRGASYDPSEYLDLFKEHRSSGPAGMIPTILSGKSEEVQVDDICVLGGRL